MINARERKKVPRNFLMMYLSRVFKITVANYKITVANYEFVTNVRIREWFEVYGLQFIVAATVNK